MAFMKKTAVASYSVFHFVPRLSAPQVIGYWVLACISSSIHCNSSDRLSRPLFSAFLHTGNNKNPICMKTNIQFKIVMVLALCAMLSAFAPFGAHNFQVFLDDTKVADQYVDRNSIIPKITIDPAENYKKLVVKYNECNRPVTTRTMTLKDNDDKVLKEINFEGTSRGLENPMSLDVKDIVGLKPKSSSTMKLYYSSNDFRQGQLVATLVIGPGKSTASK